MKECSQCNVNRSLKDYHKEAKSADGLRANCKICNKEYRKKHSARIKMYNVKYCAENKDKLRAAKSAYDKLNKDRIRDYQMQKNYGISLEDRQVLSESQEHCCGICTISEVDTSSGRLSIDHDHASGVVRGLLCQPCNVAIGSLKDSSAVALKASEYLKKNGK